MKSWQKFMVALSTLIVIGATVVLVLDYKRDKKIFDAVKTLLEKRKVIEL